MNDLYESIRQRVPTFDTRRVKLEIQGRLASVASIVCQINGCKETSMRQYLRKTRGMPYAQYLVLAQMTINPRSCAAPQLCGTAEAIAYCLARWPTKRVTGISRTFPEPFGQLQRAPAQAQYILLSVDKIDYCVMGHCTICMESIGPRDEVYRISCGHRFHSKCLEMQLRVVDNSRCPNCRANFMDIKKG